MLLYRCGRGAGCSRPACALDTSTAGAGEGVDGVLALRGILRESASRRLEALPRPRLEALPRLSIRTTFALGSCNRVMYDTRARSRSPADTVALRVEHLESRLAWLERRVQQLDGSNRWWTWWYRSWALWLQTKTNDMWQLLTRPMIHYNQWADVEPSPPWPMRQAAAPTAWPNTEVTCVAVPAAAQARREARAAAEHDEAMAVLNFPETSLHESVLLILGVA